MPHRTQVGTKVAAHYSLWLAAGETKTIRLRLTDSPAQPDPFGAEFATVFRDRIGARRPRL